MSLFIFGKDVPVLLFGLPLVASAAALAVHGMSRCPQCNARFFMKNLSRYYVAACVHCGTRIGSPLKAAPGLAARTFIQKLRELVALGEHGDSSRRLVSELQELQRYSPMTDLAPRPPDEVWDLISRDEPGCSSTV